MQPVPQGLTPSAVAALQTDLQLLAPSPVAVPIVGSLVRATGPGAWLHDGRPSPIHFHCS